jgi:hypothetical protein
MNIRYGLILMVFALVGCQNKSREAAEMICNCNSKLVEYTKKMLVLQEANDINGIATLQTEGDRLIKDASKCLKAMERELGESSMESKSFEVEVMAILKEQCPDVYTAYKQVTAE